ncbi:MAG: membrane protein insertase YidC, partial [Burkholderiales bacterium]
MNDIRRTVLWVVFTMSLFLIWDAWQKHQGKPSFISPTPARPAAAASPTPAASGVPDAKAVAGTPPAVAGAPAAVLAPAGELFVVDTDLVKATFSSVGGSLVQLDLLKHRDDSEERGPMRVVDPSHGYT